MVAGAEELGAGPDAAADAAAGTAARAAAAPRPRAGDDALAGRLRARQGALERLGAPRIASRARSPPAGRRPPDRDSPRRCWSGSSGELIGNLLIPPISPGLPPPSPATCGTIGPVVHRLRARHGSAACPAPPPAARGVQDRQPRQQQDETMDQRRARAPTAGRSAASHRMRRNPGLDIGNHPVLDG